MADSKTLAAARKFVAACKAGGWLISGDYENENIIRITKHFTPGDHDEFVRLDGEWYGILSLTNARGGSMWGTDGSGVGGHSALLHGRFQMNVSGVSKRMFAAISDARHEVDAVTGEVSTY